MKKPTQVTENIDYDKIRILAEKFVNPKHDYYERQIFIKSFKIGYISCLINNNINK